MLIAERALANSDDPVPSLVDFLQDNVGKADSTRGKRPRIVAPIAWKQHSPRLSGSFYPDNWTGRLFQVNDGAGNTCWWVAPRS